MNTICTIIGAIGVLAAALWVLCNALDKLLTWRERRRWVTREKVLEAELDALGRWCATYPQVVATVAYMRRVLGGAYQSVGAFRQEVDSLPECNVPRSELHWSKEYLKPSAPPGTGGQAETKGDGR